MLQIQRIFLQCFVMSLLFSAIAFANPDPETPPQENMSVLKVKSTPKERAMTLTINQKKWTRDVKVATLCSNPAVPSLKSVKLWMPEHNHGSTPTKFKKMETREDCFIIEKINFTMLGNWEIRVTTHDDDRAVFKMNVEEAIK